MNPLDQLDAFCPDCDGTGTGTETLAPCESCGGTGRLSVRDAMDRMTEKHIDATERARTFWEDR